MVLHAAARRDCDYTLAYSTAQRGSRSRTINLRPSGISCAALRCAARRGAQDLSPPFVFVYLTRRRRAAAAATAALYLELIGSNPAAIRHCWRGAADVKRSAAWLASPSE